VYADLEDRAALRQAVAGVDGVVHLATGAGTTWEAVERAMVQGTRNLGEAALAAGVNRLVFVSSTAALYLGPDCGMEVVSDAVPTDPKPAQRPLYARGKIAAEKAIFALVQQGLKATIVRPAVVLDRDSPMQHSGLGLWIQDNHCIGWGRGERPCPLVLGSDVAEALVRLINYPGAELDGKALNLASRVPLTAANVVAAWGTHSGRAVTFHPRSFTLAQSMEIGKWLVKKAGGRKDAAFPSWRDLKSRSLWPPLGCEQAREHLHWQPVEDREAFLTKLFEGD
jgi:nucleoside-diphosphate-sugar epimerase